MKLNFLEKESAVRKISSNFININFLLMKPRITYSNIKQRLFLFIYFIMATLLFSTRGTLQSADKFFF